MTTHTKGNGGGPQVSVQMPDPDLPVSCKVGKIRAADGSYRAALVFAMPGNTVAVPLTLAGVDAIIAELQRVRPALRLIIGETMPIERDAEGNHRVG